MFKIIVCLSLSSPSIGSLLVSTQCVRVLIFMNIRYHLPRDLSRENMKIHRILIKNPYGTNIFTAPSFTPRLTLRCSPPYSPSRVKAQGDVNSIVISFVWNTSR